MSDNLSVKRRLFNSMNFRTGLSVRYRQKRARISGHFSIGIVSSGGHPAFNAWSWGAA
ncbi:MAG: hypothetical protein JAZ20_01255 [Candidatus Thiodiazotropha weberae]|nr:hypothetical protein [Candidatus Thiodiazotropha lotti]MCG8014483.1 hypothetical protein [Candidatus Thiodiazotropha lotti]MCG8019027.1 hypothetical protein [Candidatus Thiodiazotropha lotti]MCW4206185.1 hypothetical protein [Candidatus Thiodiazotropha lotti]MCW4213964.1 hypothetical protein [Candidatus Thiodiazotropha lotti]